MQSSCGMRLIFVHCQVKCCLHHFASMCAHLLFDKFLKCLGRQKLALVNVAAVCFAFKMQRAAGLRFCATTKSRLLWMPSPKIRSFDSPPPFCRRLLQKDVATNLRRGREMRMQHRVAMKMICWKSFEGKNFDFGPLFPAIVLMIIPSDCYILEGGPLLDGNFVADLWVLWKRNAKLQMGTKHLIARWPGHSTKLNTCEFNG